jgi:hypothetical protein
MNYKVKNTNLTQEVIRMKKLIAFVLAFACVLGLVGCKPKESASVASESAAADVQESQQTTETEAQEEQTPETEVQEEQTTETEESQQTAAEEEIEPAVVMPLPVNVDLTQLEDCMVAVALEEGDFYKDETGAVMMDAAVFVYDLYDMADISMLKKGDTIVRLQEEVLISSIERLDSGMVLINGGCFQGGFELDTRETTVYYETGPNGLPHYYELGEVSLPVSPDFIYTDESSVDQEAVSYTADDFLNGAEGLAYHFYGHNTTILIEGGYVTAMTRVYTP